MAVLDGFDASEHEEMANFEPIPEGKYLAAIIESEMKPTKAGTGKYLNLTFQVLEGQYKGRNLWARLNLDNPNSTAVQIAKGELSAICRAVGILRPKDSAQLHNLPLTIKVKQVVRKDTGDKTNEIKGYSKKDVSGAGATDEVSGSEPAWMKKG